LQWLNYVYARRTCDEIGEYFGGIRPSAVSLGSRRIKERIKTDKNFKKFKSSAEKTIKNNPPPKLHLLIQKLKEEGFVVGEI